MIVIWWHYAGYVWLTNATGAEEHMRLVLLAAMAGFLVMAISLPTLFSGGGLAFGLAYLFVVVLHLGAFLWAGGRAALPGVARLAPINLGVAACVLLAGTLRASWSWLFLALGVALFGVSTLFRVEGGFSVRAGHFAERHGLAIIIVLGESVIAIGAASGGRGSSLADAAGGAASAAASLDAWAIGAVVLALGVIAALWWTYFASDAREAERALAHAPPAQQARLALTGYWYTHLLMIAGVVLLATGIRGIAPDPRAVAPVASWLVAVGVACYLLGSVAFRRSFGLRPLAPRLVAALALLAVGLASVYASGLAALALTALLLAALALLEPQLTGARRAG